MWLQIHFPIDLKMGPIIFSSHLIFELLAFYYGLRYYTWLRKKKGDVISEPRRIHLLIGAILGALFFSRIVGALERPDLFFSPPHWLYYFQAKTIVGGLLGGLFGVEWTKKILGETHSSGDLFTYPLLFGMILGRIGCFLTGIQDRTVGLPSTLPWTFDQGDGIPRHPTSLYEILFLAGLWLCLHQSSKRFSLQSGSLFKLFLTSYLLFRFFIEFIKPIFPLFLGLSAIQWSCLLGIFYYTLLIYRKGL